MMPHYRKNAKNGWETVKYESYEQCVENFFEKKWGNCGELWGKVVYLHHIIYSEAKQVVEKRKIS